MFTSFRRVMRNAFQIFWRNGLVSVATVLVMTIAVLVMGSLILFQVLLSSTIDQVKKKVDVSVYFKPDATDADIAAVQEVLKGFHDIESTEYISRDQALETFKKRHEGNSLISSALDELPDNPLGASIKIQAKDPASYQAIADSLDKGDYSGVDKINYKQNQRVFDRLTTVLTVSRAIGWGISLALGIVAALVAFNTLQLAIYTSRDEISIMRLVGASNWYVRGPFLVEGVLHGLFATILATLIFWPATLWLGPQAKEFFGGVDLFDYYISNFFQFFFTLFLFGVVLGVISSFIATWRHLKI